jgi:hypothetical protein
MKGVVAVILLSSILRPRCGAIHHLHARDERVSAVRRPEDRGFTLLHLRPILAERIDDVRRMRHEYRVGARLRRRAEQFAEGLGIGDVLVRRCGGFAIGEVGCFLDVLEPGQRRRLVGTVEPARINLADGNPDLAERVPECHSRGLALVVEIALSRDIVEVDRLGIGLVGSGGAMAKHDYKAAGAQGLHQLLIVGDRRAGA